MGKAKPYDYKMEKPFDQRFKEAQNIRKKYPTRIPCIVTPAKNSRVPEISQHKFLAQEDLRTPPLEPNLDYTNLGAL